MRSTWKKITNWELWPFKLIYAPLGFAWMYYAIKARAFWFFSNVNPTLEFAGFEGESKKEMYEQLPQHYYPPTLFIESNTVFEAVKQQLASASFSFPVIAKPSVGMQGLMVRKIKDYEQLAAYHQLLKVDYIIQPFIDLPVEFSVFHIRYPEQQKGMVTGFILKEYLQVTGDGRATLMQLIENHPKAMFRIDEMKHMHSEHLDGVVPKGDNYPLSFTGNHNRGARFINLYNEIDENLNRVFDEISLSAGHFYFGRYDLKCTSIKDLKAGKNICILEYNGAGAEPNHIYDCGMSYFNALKEIVKHWEHMYRISRINYKKGIPYWTYAAGSRHLRNASKFFDRLRQYDMQY